MQGMLVATVVAPQVIVRSSHWWPAEVGAIGALATPLPLLSEAANDAYEALMRLGFRTFGDWGEDAKPLTSHGWRAAAFVGVWDPHWDALFDASAGGEVSPEAQRSVRQKYDVLLATWVRDLELGEARSLYTRALLSYGAH
jgi:hypothetical protein